jgi:hypothetical protein
MISPSPVPVAGAAGTRLRRRLGGPAREARVVHRGRHAVYAELDGWCVGVLAAGATAVPCAVRTTLPELGPLALADRATVADGALWLADTPVRVGRLLDTGVPRLAAVDPRLVRLVLDAGRPVAEELGGLLDRPLPDLLGHGSGLTPVADDVLCGWLAAGHALGAPAGPLPDPRRRTTLLSATLVDCAAHGEVVPEFQALVRALAAADEAAVREAVGALARVGHTSGRGLLLGAGLRLDEATRQEGAA